MESENKFNRKLFVFNIVTFIWSVIFLFQIGMTYQRPCTLIKKHQSEHSYKGKYKPDYYITAQWKDQDKNVETFEVNGSTFYAHETGDTIYFRATKESCEWMYNTPGVLFGFGLVLVWVFGASLSLAKHL